MQPINSFDLGFIKDIPENIIAAQAEIDQLKTENANLKSKLNLTIIVSIVIIIGGLLYSYNQTFTDHENIDTDQ